ncbi:MAG: hypothetical protein IPH11_10635 [Ignavibacteriales bacterium]|nr:hypothetical protein [Ignavibacteriales bacterium]
MDENQLETYNRHFIYKIENDDAVFEIIDKGIKQKEKVLVVVNRVNRAQTIFENWKNFIQIFPNAFTQQI